MSLTRNQSKEVGETLQAYGAMRSVKCDHVYVADPHSQIYTSPCVSAQVTTPFDVLIAITACRQVITLQLSGNVAHGGALAASARPRALHAKGARLVIVQINPFHAAYRLFRRLHAPLKLDREKFSRFDTQLEEAYQGQLALGGAQELCYGVIEQVSHELPSLPALDARVREVMRLLFDDPRLPLEELATHSGVSYDRMSHLFIDQLGISIRSFQVWVKLQRALTGIRVGQSLVKLAQIAGFSDAAHLSRVYKQAYGAPPSYFYNSGNVKLVASFAGEIPGASDGPGKIASQSTTSHHTSQSAA